MTGTKTTNVGLANAAYELEQAEAIYRYCHDVLGAGDIRTGRAWNKMRRAGDCVRDLLKTPPQDQQNIKAAISDQRCFQDDVADWMQICFGSEISADKLERNDRFCEESLELLQSLNMPKERILALIDYVYDRDAGETNQEIGGVMVTLAALCSANHLNMESAAQAELKRVNDPAIVEKIRKKQAAKPTGSALPVADKQGSLPKEEVHSLNRAMLLDLQKELSKKPGIGEPPRYRNARALRKIKEYLKEIPASPQTDEDAE